jgi:hypothetical protein
MQEVRKPLILRSVSSGSMQRRRRDGGDLLHSFAHLDVSQHLNVAEKLLQYRFCREWIVIAGRLASESRLRGGKQY